jgi:CRP-like cAMP-binding protein
MANVGPKANILRVSAKLKQSLLGVGSLKQFPRQQSIFDVDQENQGVFLVLKGKARLYVRDYPRLDRTFSSGSLLGVPATFTGHPYSLGAVAVTATEVVHVGKQAFLDLMTEQPELCREATDLLSREVTFIQAALAERRRSKTMAVTQLIAS